MMAGRDTNTAVAGGLAGHIPVLLDEVVEVLDPNLGDVLVDGTFGDGGYSRALLAAGASFENYEPSLDQTDYLIEGVTGSIT